MPKKTTLPKLFLYGFLGSLFLILIAGLTAPMVIRCVKKSELTTAINNLRQIGLALYEFEQEYNSYPTQATTTLVTKNHPNHALDLTGTSSNALLRQLIAAEITTSEQIFYAPVQGTQKPDDNISPTKALAKGEVAFAYISKLSTEDNPAQILAFAPIIPGTQLLDPKSLKGKAAILRMDNSVSTVRINKNGQMISSDGQNLLSPAHPIWNGKTPEIHYPELQPEKSFLQKLFSK